MEQSSDVFDESSINEEEEEYTAEEVLAKLQEAWVNEKNSPELLQPKTEIVECMLEQIATMEQNLASLSKGDLRMCVHKMELSRIKFLIHSYLRTRLDKIQNNFHFYSKTDIDNPSRLSPEETDFLNKYKQTVENLFQSLCLRHLPGSFDIDKTGIKPPHPNNQAAVFVQVEKDVAGLEIRDTAGQGREETLDLEAGEQHLLQYAAIAHLIESGTVTLT